MSFTLYSHKIHACPHHQRVVIAAFEKKVDLTIEIVKLREKLWDHNRHDMVPILKDNDKLIKESTNIVLFLNSAMPNQGTQLEPQDIYAKAHMRYYLNYSENRLCAPFYKIMAEKKMSKMDHTWLHFLEDLQIFTETMDPEGPFFFGKTISAVDINFIPYALRYDMVISKLYPHYDLRQHNPHDNKWMDRYFEWLDAAKYEESVAKSMPQDITEWIEEYTKFNQIQTNRRS